MALSDKIFTIPNLSLLYQLVGTLLLGWALATTSIDAITKLSGTNWDFNKPVAVSLANQRTDAQFGVAILALGIILQILENVLCLSEKSSSKCLTMLGMGFLVFLVIAYPFVRNCLCKEITKQVESNIANRDRPSSASPQQ